MYTLRSGGKEESCRECVYMAAAEEELPVREAEMVGNVTRDREKVVVYT